jgi:DNA-binding GntR family transcriptional regulator
MSAELDPTPAAGPSKGSAPAPRHTAHVYVRESLRQDILNGTLPGGTRLAQTDIAKQLGVSTTPVREALRDLASEGLVIIDPHRGGFVMELTSDDVFEIYEIRYQLEPIALRYALPFIDDEIIERLDQLNAEMSATSHLPTWVELNRDFHMTMYAASNRSRLLSIIRSVQDGSVMAVAGRLAHTTGVRDEANQEHTNLVDALRHSDYDLAMALLQHHLERHTHG